jgi:hypothetical protein
MTTTTTTKQQKTEMAILSGNWSSKTPTNGYRFYSIVWEREPNPSFSSDPHSTLLPNI